MSLYNVNFDKKYVEFDTLRANYVEDQTLIVNTLEVLNDLDVTGTSLVKGNTEINGNFDVKQTLSDMVISNGSLDIQQGSMTAEFNDIIVNGSVITNEGFVAADVGEDLDIGNPIQSIGTHTWASGENTNDNPLTISTLVGGQALSNSFKGLRLRGKFKGTPDGSGNYLRVRLNNAGPELEYATRIIREGTDLVDDTSKNHWRLCSWDNASNREGMIDCVIYVGLNTSDYCFMSGTLCASEMTSGSGIYSEEIAGRAFVNGTFLSVTELVIDVENNSHSGWTLEYELTRFQ